VLERIVDDRVRDGADAKPGTDAKPGADGKPKPGHHDPTRDEPIAGAAAIEPADDARRTQRRLQAAIAPARGPAGAAHLGPTVHGTQQLTRLRGAVHVVNR
jgi:hypothetical protein